jgi:hypothetical protein
MWCLIVKLISPSPWCLDGALPHRPVRGIPAPGAAPLAPSPVPLRGRVARPSQGAPIARERR